MTGTQLWTVDIRLRDGVVIRDLVDVRRPWVEVSPPPPAMTLADLTGVHSAVDVSYRRIRCERVTTMGGGVYYVER